MSIWCDIDGKAEMHKSVHFSFRKFIEDVFDDEVIEHTKVLVLTDDQNDIRTQHFQFSFCEDGEDAAAIIRKMMKKVPHDVKIDMNTHIRWFS